MKGDDVKRMVEEMTTNRLRERTRQLAEQAGFVLWYGAERRYRKKQIAVDWASNYDDELEKFAELVRADEREACAEICDGISEWYETRTDLNQTQKQVGQLAAEVCGVRIRERGEK